MAGVLACFLVIDVNPAQQGFESRFGVARHSDDPLIGFMKEPSAPQITYDGSLKELAKAHVGLVWALIYVLTVPVGVWGLWFAAYSLYGVHNGWRMDVSLVVTSFIDVIPGCIGIYLIWSHCIRLGRLLFPHLSLVFCAFAVFPLTSLPLVIFLWVSAIRQLRARGLQVGIFGINPAKVDS